MIVGVPVSLPSGIIMTLVERPKTVVKHLPPLTFEDRHRLLDLAFRRAKASNSMVELCRVAEAFCQLAYERLQHASNLVPGAKEALLEAPLAIY